MPKSADAFRTIREVSEWLETPAHVLRFWESKFRQVSPVKRAGGRRYYRPADMLLLGGLKKLLHEDDMSIKDAVRFLKTDGVKAVQALSRPLDASTEAAPVPEVTQAEAIPEIVTPAPAVPPEAAAIPAMPEGSVLKVSSQEDVPETPQASAPAASVEEPSQLSLLGTPEPGAPAEKAAQQTETEPKKPARRVAPVPVAEKDPFAEPDLFSLMDPESVQADNEITTEPPVSEPEENQSDATPILPAEVEEPGAPIAETPLSVAEEPSEPAPLASNSATDLPEVSEDLPPAATVAEAIPPAPPSDDTSVQTTTESAVVPEDPADDAVLTDEHPVLASILETPFPELVAVAPALEVATSRLETLRNRMASR